MVLLARKGEHTVLIALNEDFSVSKLAEVPYDLYEYALFAMNYDHPSQFAFVVKDRERYRIVSNG